MRKYIITIIAICLIATPILAQQLWEYGSYQEREIAYQNISSDIYFGTYEQNIRLLEWYESQFDSELIFGATRPIAGATYTLAGSGITSSASSITLQSFTIPQNDYKIQDSDLSDTFYITLEPGSTKRQEIVSCTTTTQNANDTATLSGCTRGLSPITPFTASTTLRFAHAGGSQVIFSDPPQLFNEYVSLANAETISGLKTFSIFPEFSDGTTPTSTNQFATKGYADNIANQGAATSTESVAGISELATVIESASSTPWGINDPHVQQSEHASSTPSDARTGLWDIWTENDGYMSQSWLDLTEDFEFSSNVTTTANFTATSATTTNSHHFGEICMGLYCRTDFSLQRYAGQNTLFSAAGSVSEQTIYATSVPSNLLETNGVVRITMSGKTAQDTNARTMFKVTLGSTELIIATSTLSGVPYYFTGTIGNRNSASAQFGTSQLMSSDISGSSASTTIQTIKTGTEDTTTDLALTISVIQTAFGSAVTTVEMLLIEIIK